jgi:hypothetical protein
MAELAFRARQELTDVLLLVANPRLRSGAAASPLTLPDPQPIVNALRGSEYARGVEALARRVLTHRFPLLGIEMETGPQIRWRRDYLHGKESGTQYFRRIPYLDFSAVGDHKIIWELNRHQHLVLLAQAYRFTDDSSILDELFAELDDWLEQNPFHRGINWASALEVGFRALSWIWVFHLVGNEMEAALHGRFLTALYQHARHLAANLSIYFSPNTHLLGEAVALYAIAKLFPAFPHAAEWQQQASKIVEAQLSFQVRQDGSHFEQSTYYHVYALDFFAFYYLLAGRPPAMVSTLTRMAEYLHSLLGPARRIAFLGDDDGGRLFHPYGERDTFGRATLTTCGILFDREDWIGNLAEAAEQAAWWIGVGALEHAREHPTYVTGSRCFEDAGAVFLQSGDFFLQMDCGPFGYGGAGHSHSDTLSIVATLAGERLFVDPGTYTYIANPKERNWFRGSGAHNTVRIDALDQAEPAGPFRWSAKPDVELVRWEPSRDGGTVEAVCHYRGFSHRRCLTLEKDRLLVLDEIEGSGGEHACEQIWQLGPAAGKVDMTFSAPARKVPSWFSPAYGSKSQNEAIICAAQGSFPLRIAMLLTANGEGQIRTDENLLAEHEAKASASR